MLLRQRSVNMTVKAVTGSRCGRPSAPSASSACPAEFTRGMGLAAPAARTVAGDADGSGEDGGPTVRVNFLENGVQTDAGGAGANAAPQPGPAIIGVPGIRHCGNRL